MLSANEDAMVFQSRFFSAIWVVALCLLSGCGGKKSEASKEESASDVLADESVVAGQGNGLEVRWWLADDTEGAVGDAIARLGEVQLGGDVTSTVSTRWEANGLRWVKIPVARLPELERAAKPLRVVNKLWLARAAEWTELFRGTRAMRPGVSGAVLITSEGAERVSPGQLRFLARCWPTSTASADESGLVTVMRLDLAVQSYDRAESLDNNPFATPTIVKAEKLGQVLRPLTVETALVPGYAYVLTAEQPGVVWGVEPGTGEAAIAPPSRGHGTQDSSNYGPPSPAPTTVGEAMMTAVLPEDKTRTAKAIVVLVPRVIGTGG